ncbi:hypothetical protein SDC9_114109 [bioreactor metagenome]|uniref:Uncharacterized protein n=1 Tax=bioreactor metagenome TaxID=1076179 RepID=A0A645BPQ7_9ZZZZ
MCALPADHRGGNGKNGGSRSFDEDQGCELGLSAAKPIHSAGRAHKPHYSPYPHPVFKSMQVRETG